MQRAKAFSRRAAADAALHGFGSIMARRTRAIVGFFNLRMEPLITVWIVVMALAAVGKAAMAPVAPAGLAGYLVMLLPFLLVAFAPVAGYRLAVGSFPRGVLAAQPLFRFARIGRWRQLGVVDARSNPAFGPAGFMASLLVGLILNVPVRTAEYLAVVPAIGHDAPQWAHAILFAMSADVIVMNFIYMVCFVMALRAVPLFPRMMVFAWVLDLFLQFGIASQVSAAPGLPPQVAGALLGLLQGNIDKVLVSVAVWLPYLLLSERVNVTYRMRSGRKGGCRN